MKDDTKEIKIPKLTIDELRNILSKKNIDSRKLTKKELELLRLPIYLDIYFKIKSNKENFNIKSRKSLFDELFKNVVTKLKSKNENHKDADFTDAIECLIDHMEKEQEYTANLKNSTFDKHRSLLEALVSEGILFENNGKISFYHDMLFDYFFARMFCRKNENLFDYLSKSEQDLSIRTRIQTILEFLRDDRKREYIDQLKKVLLSDKIRYHIKQRILLWLKNLEEPNEDEYKVLLSLKKNETINNADIFRIFYSPAWFDILNSKGALSEWLNGNDEDLAHKAWVILLTVQGERSKEVAEMLTPFIGKSQMWNDKIKQIIESQRSSITDEYSEFIIKSIESGLFDRENKEFYEDNMFSSFIDIYKNKNEKLFILLKNILSHYFKKVNDSKQVRENLSKQAGYYFSRFLAFCHNESPEFFCEHIFTLFYEIVEKDYNENKNLSKAQRFFSLDFYLRNTSSISHRLISSIIISLVKTSKKEPEKFRNILDKIKYKNIEIFDFISIKIYEGNSVVFSNEAIDYFNFLYYNQQEICNNGFINNFHSEMKKVLPNLIVHCSQEIFDQFEKTVLNYYPPHEYDYCYLKQRGKTQYILLSSMDTNRLSPDAKKRLQEWERKFGPERCLLQTYSGPVVSPVSGEKIKTDKQWLSAIKKYNSNKSTGHYQNGQFKGGARELASQLELLVQKEPARFAKLLNKFPRDTHKEYFSAVINGLASAGFSDKSVFDVCRLCHAFPDKPYGKEISFLIAKTDSDSLPSDILDMLIYYTSLNLKEEDDKSLDLIIDSHRLYQSGLYILRGYVAFQIQNLLFKNKKYIKYFVPTVKKMAHDSSIAVRSVIVSILLAFLNDNEHIEIAVDLFIFLCAEADEILLGTVDVGSFIYYTYSQYFNRLKPILLRMINSDKKDVCLEGARLISLASLSIEEAWDIANKYCIDNKNEWVRAGCAQIYSKNLDEISKKEDYLGIFRKYFNDNNKDVREFSCQVFESINEINKHICLLEEFRTSCSFYENITYITPCLKKSIGKQQPEILEIVISFLQGLAENKIKRNTFEHYEIFDIPFKVYQDNIEDRDIKKKCLDIIDLMLWHQIYQANEAIFQFENE